MAKILAVDDSVSMRQMITHCLKHANHDVTEASDGMEALQLAKKQRFDLVLTDVNMPKMDGISLTRELRSLPSYRRIPILTLTTESSPEKKQAGKAAGATGWIVKPFTPDKLLSTINRVLN